MQQKITSLTQITKLKCVVSLLLLLLGFASPNVLAKGPSALKAGKGEVERYLHGKYKIKESVKGVVIMNGKVPHAVLLELFTEHGVGTLVTK